MSIGNTSGGGSATGTPTTDSSIIKPAQFVVIVAAPLRWAAPSGRRSDRSSARADPAARRPGER